MSRDRAQAEPDVAPGAPRRASAGALGAGLVGEVLRLQATAGNRAVARRVSAARRALLQRDPTVPGRSRTIGAPPSGTVALPPPQQPGPAVTEDDNAVHPAVDVAGDARTATVTVVLRNFNLPPSADTSSIDFLHEPGVSVQVTPGTPQAVVQAAIAAINVHLRRHARELIELSVSPQASVDSNGTPSVGAQAQAEIHVTSSFSYTVSTSIAATPHQPDTDPGSVRVGQLGSWDLNWSPISVGVLFHLDAQDTPRRPAPVDYAAAAAEGRFITWVINQLDASDFSSPAAGQLEIYTFVRELLGVMRGASGEEAQWTLHLGAMQPNEIPSGLTHGLTRAAGIIAGTSSQFGSLRRIRVSMLNLGPTRDGPERLVRWTLLDVGRETATPAAATPTQAPQAP